MPAIQFRLREQYDSYAGAAHRAVPDSEEASIPSRFQCGAREG
jgi:hypothetical protein